MNLRWRVRRFVALGLSIFAMLGIVGLAIAEPAFADSIEGQVLGGGAPIGKSTVTLWSASADAPKQLAQTQSGDDGRFTLSVEDASSPDSSLYLIAKGGVPTANQNGGDNSAIALIAVLGSKPPAKVTINEFTTVASVWTNAQFLDGGGLRGNSLGLHIAARNVPNFIDLETGGWGSAIQDPLNGPQTPTMANFATLSDILAGCVARVTANACDKLFAAATPPKGNAPSDTMTAAESIARSPWYQPGRLYALLDAFYPIPQGKNLRPVPYMPYLNWQPSAWVLPLKFDGGGYRAGGKAGFDSEGNLWVGDNFSVGWQGQDSLWEGHATKFAPDGKTLSPITEGFSGGGMEGGTFGAAVDAKDNAWFSTYGSKAIVVFDKDGKPLTPPDGITFNGRLGLMQGVMVTPSGDVWVLGVEKRQLVYFPKGDLTKGKIVCEGDDAEPCRSFVAPFHLAIDKQDRIWVSNSGINHVTRFPASDPSKAETFKSGFNTSGLAIDSQGNVWVTARFGNSVVGMMHLVDMGLRLKLYGLTKASDYLTKTMSEQKGGSAGGSMVLLRPDGSPYPGSPFIGRSLPGPWAVAVDGDDNVWVSNFAGASGQIAHLCGVRTENCPTGSKTGDPISPPLGYVGGGLQMEVDIEVDPAGNVWVTNNWQDIDSCIGTPAEGLSTRCGGQGVVVFYGMAKPVRAPQIGPAQGF
jgi:sugar lactone lactonase YvrE